MLKISSLALNFAQGTIGGLEALCVLGYNGVLCSQCDVGFYASGDECTECPGDPAGSAALMIFVLIVVIGVFCLFARIAGRMNPPSTDAEISSSRPSFLNPLNIMLSE